MANQISSFIEYFSYLDIDTMRNVIDDLQTIYEAKKVEPKNSMLKEAWEEIERMYQDLSRYRYIDDQVEIEEVWEISENLIKSGKLKDEDWEVRKKVLSHIIDGDYYDYYGCYDPMKDLSKALCITDQEKRNCADMMAMGSRFMQQEAAEIYKEIGEMDKAIKIKEKFLDYKIEPYVEVADYYLDKDIDKSIELLEKAKKKSGWGEDRTQIYVGLAKAAILKNDKAMAGKVIRGAKTASYVDADRVISVLQDAGMG